MSWASEGDVENHAERRSLELIGQHAVLSGNQRPYQYLKLERQAVGDELLGVEDRRGLRTRGGLDVWERSRATAIA